MDRLGYFNASLTFHQPLMDISICGDKYHLTGTIKQHFVTVIFYLSSYRLEKLHRFLSP